MILKNLKPKLFWCCVIGKITLPSHASLDSDVTEYMVVRRRQCVRLVQCAKMTTVLLYICMLSMQLKIKRSSLETWYQTITLHIYLAFNLTTTNLVVHALEQKYQLLLLVTTAYKAARWPNMYHCFSGVCITVQACMNSAHSEVKYVLYSEVMLMKWVSDHTVYKLHMYVSCKYVSCNSKAISIHGIGRTVIISISVLLDIWGICTVI